MSTTADHFDASADPRSATNALFNDNRLKLGTFCTNISGGGAISTIDGTYQATWPETVRISQIADDAGFEALVPVARWRGFGGKTNFNGRNFETYTWAAGLGALTHTTTVFSTSHVPTIHPIVAAKQATTIDHISGGRFALNVVCGWFEPELRMFGSPMMEHDTAYEYAAEWLEVVKLLWTREDEFDFEGKWFKIDKGFHQPKPIQKPFPCVMNAGFSPVGREFALKHSDVTFTNFRGAGYDLIKTQIAEFRARARKEYGREIGIWINTTMIMGDTLKDAQALYHETVEEKGDWEAIENMFNINGMYTRVDRRQTDDIMALKRRYMAGWGGELCIGTPEMLADELEKISDLGVDGAVMTFPRFEDGIRRFVAEVVPLLIQKGLRKPARRAARAAE